MGEIRDTDEFTHDLQTWLEKVGASEQHDRLEAFLDTIATASGFITKETFENGTRPDVLRSRANVLVIADAKVYPHDVPGNARTEAQIRNYVEQFKKAGKFGTAVILIATNDPVGAEQWSKALPEWAADAGLTPGKFSVVASPSKITWSVIGGVGRP